MKNLYARLLHAVEHFEANSQTAFAKKIGCQQSTFHGYLNEEGQRKIRLTLLEDILCAYPGISREWLYFGEGSMFRGEAVPPPLSATNRKGMLTGDLLRVVLDFARISAQEAAARSGIDEAALQYLLESRICPAFEELESLYLHLGINPAYFFDGNEAQMYQPEDPLLRVYYALGKQGITPQAVTVSEIFGVPLDEAKAFMKEWREFREQGACRVLPAHWYDALADKYGLNPGWLKRGNPPVVMPQGRAGEGKAPEPLERRYAEAMDEMNDLKTKVIDLQAELLSMHRERGRDRENDGVISTSAPGGNYVAPSSHRDNDNK